MKAIGFLVAAGALGAGLYFGMRGGGGGLSGTRTRTRLRGDAEVGELKVFVDNDGALYRQRTTPIMKNLALKLAKGIYDKTKAEKVWMYLVEDGAKKYAKDSGNSVPWHEMFSMTDRRAVARRLNDEFLAEWKLGNYNNLLPKKYQA